MSRKKLTTQEFIEKVIKIHENKYDYSFVNYTATKNNIKIICPIHGEFNQRASTHLGGSGCPKCGNERQKNFLKCTNDEFIGKVKKVHRNKYDYSLTQYLDSRLFIKIICSKHGEFKQIASIHLKGNGCKKCVNEKMSLNYRLSNNKFIKKGKNVHGDKFDYSKIKYSSSINKVIIICPIHGEFNQIAHSHLQGNGCLLCKTNNRLTTNEFIKKAMMIHEDKYNYTQTNYVNAKNKITIICSIHGNFKQKPTHHLQGSGCPKCKLSKGEISISNYLNENNVEFVHQKRFNDCICKRKLPFDFYIEDKNLLIEYDGEHHFKSIEHWGREEDFKHRQLNDKIKNEYAKKNKIELIRIPYYEYNQIENILKIKLENI